MLTVENLDFYYEDKQALFDINVSLPRESITGLVGPNGAGKSTLMRCMAGLEIPYTGNVRLNNEPILDNPRKSFAQLGYLPDFFGLPSHLTVIQYLTFAAKSHNLSDNLLPQALENTVNLLGLQDKLYRPIQSLSRGQKQRLGIGQVIIHRPSFLLLDEPASGLDPEARHELSKLLLQLKSEGMTIVVSSHILSELDEYCTHMLIIREGKIQAYQPLSQENPEQQIVSLHLLNQNEDVLKLIAQLPMVQNMQLHGEEIWLTLPNDNQIRAQLIQQITQANIGFSELKIVKSNMLQSYQDSLNKKD